MTTSRTARFELARIYLARAPIVGVFVLIAMVATMASATESTASELQPDRHAARSDPPEAPAASPERSAEMDAFEAAAAWQVSANEAVEQIRVRFPDDFAFGEIRGDAIHVAFASQAPVGALTVLEQTGFSVDIEEQVGFSAVQLGTLAETLHEVAQHLTSPGASLATGPVESQRKLDVQSDEPFVDQDRNVISPDAAARLIAQGVGDLQGFSIRVAVLEKGTIGDAGYGQAGGNAVDAVGGGDSCTSGFVVTDAHGPDLGVITAGHCANSLRQISPNGNFLFNVRAEFNGSIGDMQWMRSPVMMDAWFHCDTGLGRPVTGKSTVTVGSSICLYGRAGGRQCGSVDATNQTLTTQSGTTGGLARVTGTANLVQPGDSGGPLYIGNIALGIIKGYGAFNSFFTPIDPVLNRFGLQLCLDPPGCQ